MKIETHAFTPKPDQWAHTPAAWAVGSWEQVILGQFRVSPTSQQSRCLDGLKEGDVLVTYDAAMLVKEMHLMIGNRLVKMHDGFDTKHVVMLLTDMKTQRALRESSDALHEASIKFTEQLARLTTSTEAATSRGESVDADWHEGNSEAIDTLITRAREITGIRPVITEPEEMSHGF